MKDLRVTDECWKRLMQLKLNRKAKNVTAIINELLDHAQTEPLEEWKEE